MAVKFTSPPKQLFECRDCPARCCRVPWSIRFTADEIARYADEAWIRERAGDDGMKVLMGGILPMREHERRLQCVFLDDDHLCAMQKEFGHSFIPRACQAFPFGFQRNEKDVLVAQLSHLCPSIRDNYGLPVAKQLKAKLEQKGEAERMTTALSTVNRIILSRSQYLLAVKMWTTQLSDDRSVAQILADLYDRTLAFEEALPGDAEKVKDGQVKTALSNAKTRPSEPLAALDKPSFHARSLYSYLLGNLSYPSRVRQPHRVGRAPFGSLHGLRSLANKWAWLRGRGTVDLLFIDQPVKLRRAAEVAPFLDQAEGALIRNYLRTVLDRRQLFATPRYLLDALIDLCLATVLISRFARCRAAAAERSSVSADDVREGISVAELVVLSHVTLTEQGKTMANLRALMLSSRDRLRDLLASEV
ncbi:MAG: YkgJ family cysteine cluster protein [Myxococcota bacterium]